MAKSEDDDVRVFSGPIVADVAIVARLPTECADAMESPFRSDDDDNETEVLVALAVGGRLRSDDVCATALARGSLPRSSLPRLFDRGATVVATLSLLPRLLALFEGGGGGGGVFPIL